MQKAMNEWKLFDCVIGFLFLFFPFHIFTYLVRQAERQARRMSVLVGVENCMRSQAGEQVRKIVVSIGSYLHLCFIVHISISCT